MSVAGLVILVISALLLIISAVMFGWAISFGLESARQLAAMQQQLEEALAWSEKYQLDAADASARLAITQREYAVLAWLHDGTIALEQSAAWRHGLGWLEERR